MNENLADLFQKKQKRSGAAVAVDWDDRRDKYLAAVEDLYRQIEAMLREPIKQKTVTLQRRSKQLTENYIGTYSVDDLILSAAMSMFAFRREVGTSSARPVVSTWWASVAKQH